MICADVSFGLLCAQFWNCVSEFPSSPLSRLVAVLRSFHRLPRAHDAVGGLANFVPGCSPTLAGKRKFPWIKGVHNIGFLRLVALHRLRLVWAQNAIYSALRILTASRGCCSSVCEKSLAFGTPGTT